MTLPLSYKSIGKQVGSLYLMRIFALLNKHAINHLLYKRILNKYLTFNNSLYRIHLNSHKFYVNLDSQNRHPGTRIYLC